MHHQKIIAIFDQQAATYDEKWGRLAPINAALHLLAGTVLSGLPSGAHLLCVGAGTGTEILHFASRFPGWRFTAVEPSSAMLDVLRRRVAEHGIAHRCVYHEGFLDSLPPGEPFDAATAFLVSQFILERPARMRFFQAIAQRLCPDGILVSSDLAGDLAAPEGASLLETWFRLMRGGGLGSEEIEKMREAYARDVAVLPTSEVHDILKSGGFPLPVHFFQSGMIHAWYARRSPVGANPLLAIPEPSEVQAPS